MTLKKISVYIVVALAIALVIDLGHWLSISLNLVSKENLSLLGVFGLISLLLKSIPLIFFFLAINSMFVVVALVAALAFDVALWLGILRGAGLVSMLLKSIPLIVFLYQLNSKQREDITSFKEIIKSAVGALVIALAINLVQWFAASFNQLMYKENLSLFRGAGLVSMLLKSIPLIIFFRFLIAKGADFSEKNTREYIPFTFPSSSGRRRMTEAIVAEDRNESKNISPGMKDTLLDVFLSAMPSSTQLQQKQRFASVAANFEFGCFIPMQSANQIAEEAMKKGFTVWGNVDATSAFFYGAGMVGQEEFKDVMTWIRNAAIPDQKINVAIHNIGEPMKLIEIRV